MTPHEQAERLREIAGRIEAGESGVAIDREALIATGVLHVDTDPRSRDCGRVYRIVDGIRQVGGQGDTMMIDPLTTSLDASEALRVRLLPDHDWILGHTNGGLTIHCQMGPDVTGYGDTPAQAYCAATLRAYAAKLEDDYG